jgi:hypothetical protein
MVDLNSDVDPRASRRTVVRTAAWSVPVVAVAAAAPAFAVSGASSTLAGGAVVKWSNGNEKHVSWDLTLTNGSTAIDTITITFTYAPTSTGPFTSFTIYGYSGTTGPRDTTWSAPAITVPTSTITATHTNDIPASAVVRIHTDFAGGDNAAGTVTATAVIKYVGVPGTVTKSLGPLSWSAGSMHVHPA